MNLNLGAGQWRVGKLAKWISVDLNPRNKTDIIHDLRKMPYPFGNNSIDFIYASHIVEHFTYDEAFAFFKECNRILIHGGAIRIALPDYRKAMSMYISGEFDSWYKKLIKNHEMSKLHPTPLLALSKQFIFAGQEHELGHKSLWDEETVRHFLHQTKFITVVRNNFGESTQPEFRGIDNRPMVSFYMEGIK